MKNRRLLMFFMHFLVLTAATLSILLSSGLHEQNHSLLHWLSQTQDCERPGHDNEDHAGLESIHTETIESCSLVAILSSLSQRTLGNVKSVYVKLLFATANSYSTPIEKWILDSCPTPHLARGPPV